MTQVRRRHYGAKRIRVDKLVLYNPVKMRVERYRNPGAQIATPFNIDVVDPAGARFRRTGHDDVEFVGQVSELISCPIADTWRARCGDNPHAGFGGRGRETTRRRLPRPPDHRPAGTGAVDVGYSHVDRAGDRGSAAMAALLQAFTLTRPLPISWSLKNRERPWSKVISPFRVPRQDASPSAVGFHG